MCTNKRLVIRTTVAVVIFVFVAVFATVIQPAIRARQFVRIFSTMPPGTDVAIVRQVAIRFHADIAPTGCSSDCTYTFLFKTSLIPLVRGRGLSADMETRDGKLVHSGVAYSMGIEPVTYVSWCDNCLPTPVRKTIFSRYKGNMNWKAIVELTNAATDSQRKSAFNFRISCLLSVIPCKDVNDISPELRHID